MKGCAKQIDLLAEQERMLRRGAEAESGATNNWPRESSSTRPRAVSEQARVWSAKLPKATNEAAAAGIGASELEQRIASIREKFAEKNTEAMKAQRPPQSCWPKTWPRSPRWPV